MNLFNFGLSLALIIRFYLQLLAGLPIKFIPFKRPNWLWGSFDGAHYISIAKEGYLSGLTQTYLPLYPILIRWLTFLTKNQFWSGILLSHLFFIGFIYYFIKLGCLDYSVKTIRWALVILLLFPTSFFFFSLYTESLFLFLAALSLYLARTKRFFLSALIAGLASATRLVGIFLLPAILWEYCQVHKKPKILSLAQLTVLASSGLLGYLLYLQHRFHNFLIFATAQPGSGVGRQVDTIVMLYQVIFRYLKMFFAVSPQNDIYLVLVFEFVISMIFLGLIIYALIKKFRPGYLLFFIPSFLLPTFTGSFASMPRYVLAGFPLFYLLASTKSKPLKIIALIFSALLLTWAFVRFSRGYWIT